MSGRRSRTKKKRGGGLIVLLIVLIALAVSSYFVFKGWDKAYDAASTEAQHIVIESGMGTESIANVLKENGIIGNTMIFRLKSKLNGYDGKLQAGSFELSASMTTNELFKALMDAKRESVRITIPEGYNIKQTAEKLAEQGLVDYDTFISVADNGNFDYRFLDGIPKGENRLEGFLFPDTYDIFVGASEEDIIEKFLSRFDEVFTDEFYEKAAERGLTVKEAVTIASLIEEETKTADERALVSSVIYNRLDIDMKLQFCSTVLYSLGEQKSRLLYSDLEVESPYNTYKHEGLPPGPISSPGKACLEAALSPADTDYLYFVLKGDGSGHHNFAENSKDFSNYKEDYLNTLQ